MGQLSETGSHATLNAICDRFAIRKSTDGRTEAWELRYCGVDDVVWAMSLFSILLTCFTMEHTFFEDYSRRLELDHVLIRMRNEFESYKERLRQLVKARYEVKLPLPKPLIIGQGE